MAKIFISYRRDDSPYAAESNKLEEVGWYRNNSGRKTHPTGGMRICDMSGARIGMGSIPRIPWPIQWVQIQVSTVCCAVGVGTATHPTAPCPIAASATLFIATMLSAFASQGTVLKGPLENWKWSVLDLYSSNSVKLMFLGKYPTCVPKNHFQSILI